MKQQNDATAQPSKDTGSSKSSDTADNDASKLAENLEEPKFTIRLKNYQLRKNKNDFFAGRDKEKLKLGDILDANWNHGGAYLVAGYRGVGKTAFVNTVLNEYTDRVNKRSRLDQTTRSKARKVLQIHLSLGNEKRLDSRLVLNDIVSLMLEEFKGKCRTTLLYCRGFFIFSLFILGLLLLLALELLSVLGQPWSALINLFTPLNNGLSEPVTRSSFHWIYLSVITLTAIWLAGKKLDIFLLDSTSKIHHRLSLLLTHMSHSSEKSHGVNLKGFSSQRRYRREALNNNEIERELKNILKIATDSGWHVIFIFDELDKLTNRGGDLFEPGEAQDDSENRNRKKQVDSLLGELKNLISTTPATYIFISGRDMYDAYLSELGSPNSLYESLFKDHIYIPSLLTDRSDGDPYLLDSMIEHVVVSQILPSVEKENVECKENKKPSYLSLGDLRDSGWGENDKDSFFSVKTFVHFLTIHSWGNYKRIITLFDSFIVRDQEDNYYYRLEFYTKDIQRLILSSHLYILFHHNLARVFINADDKLVVSSFAVFHYIMKFHDMGFSRSHIDRMYQTLNVHSSPELAKVVEIIIKKVLNDHIRKVRNSYYRYRFSSLYEQEIHYIATISEKESAAFNFSLDAMDTVKRSYKKMLKAELEKNNIVSNKAVASLHVILGNFHFWEQSFDKASTQYQSAISIYENENVAENLDVLMSLVEAYMKRASVEERVGNYPLSAAIYTKAIEQVKQHWKPLETIHLKDSKMDMLKQPYWALKFLHLKRSAVHYIEGLSISDSLLDWQPEDVGATSYPQCCHHQNQSEDDYYNQFADIDVWHYRRAVIKFYMGQANLSYKCFMNVANQLNVLNAHDERSCYLGGKVLLRAGYSLLIGHSKEIHLKMSGRVLKRQLEQSFHQPKDETKYQKRMMELIEMLEEYLPFLNSVLDTITMNTENTPLTSLEAFRKYALEYKDGNLRFKPIQRKGLRRKGDVFPYAIGLISLSATAFERSKLNANAAAAYLSIVSMWTLHLEMLPWRLFATYTDTGPQEKHSEELDKNSKEKFNKVVNDLTDYREKIANAIRGKTGEWVKEAGNFAFERDNYSTSKAMSHSAKVLLRRSHSNNSDSEDLFATSENANDMVINSEFHGNYIYQHHSMFGQVALSSIQWEKFSSQHLTEENDSKVGDNRKILPSSIRYYSTMLWLQGRENLNTIVTTIEWMPSMANLWKPSEEKYFLQKALKQEAIKALVNFYRASQYVVKTAGDSSNAIIPPLFMIYYHMWEVVFYLVESFHTEMGIRNHAYTYEKAISIVVIELDEVLKESNVRDVSSRILDLSNLSVYALDHFSIALKMGDPNSREATSTLQGKYYLDDDFEDDIFTLDWSYTQAFAPGAYLHSQVIKVEMARLQAQFKK